MPYYISLQVSAIQRTILRHDRLWSLSGISHKLSYLNEIEMPRIVSQKSGKTIVSAGGKFTAYFDKKSHAQTAKDEIMKLISTVLPMIEVQYSDVLEASDLKDAINKDGGRGLITQLAEAKRCFRGFGFTYNPHIQVCDECGEYPAEKAWDKDERLCRICFGSYESSSFKTQELMQNSESKLTSIERIYRGFLGHFDSSNPPQIPSNFENLFTSDKEVVQRQMMAVWVSDINNMGDKIPLWFSQDEGRIPAILSKVTDFNIKVITQTLKDVFGKDTVTSEDGKRYMPFRVIIGGGDDLCIVMRDRDILKFTIQLSKNLHSLLEEEVNKDHTHPLNITYLEAMIDRSKGDKQLKPHSFGGAFVVVPIHTPFKAIHHIAESLMKEAKQKTDRIDNSVNWRVLSADEETMTQKLLPFDKPLLIEKTSDANKLTFQDYYDMAMHYYALSSSHRQQIILKTTEILSQTNEKDEAGRRLETFLKRMPAASSKEDSLHNQLIVDKRIREDGVISIKGLCTLFELIGLVKEGK